MNIREHVIDQIKPVLPADWKLVAHATVDKLDTTLVTIFIKSITRLPQAPQTSQRFYNLTLSIFSPLSDPARADNDLDDKIIELLAAIEGIENLRWTKAERVFGGPSAEYLGFDIDLEVPYAPTPEN